MSRIKRGWLCGMIKDNVRFNGYRDFYRRHDVIKNVYELFNREDKTIYKYYVYSRRYLKEYTCDLIWQFLNDSGDVEITKEMLSEERVKYRM